MEKSSDGGRRFIMLPSSLLPVLSDTGLRIILYAIYRERLVELGYLKDWCLYLTDVENRFANLKGYSLNTVRKGIRELTALHLIVLKDGDHYDLNVDELKKWFLKDSSLGLPNSGRGRLPKSGRAGLPKSGSQEKRDKEKRIKRAEREIAPIEGTISPMPKAPAQPPASRKSLEDTFNEIFPETKGLKSRPKTLEEQFADVFPKHSSEPPAPGTPEKIPTVSGTAAEPSETLSPTNSGQSAQTTPPTDPKRRQKD